MVRRICFIISSILIIALLWLYHPALLTWVETSGRESVVLTTLIATVMSLFPVIPYPLVGGVIGAVFGPAGAVIIWAGSSLASIIFFLMVRYGGMHRYGERLLRSYPAVSRLTVLFERNAFMSLTVLRMIPVIPSIIINAYAALSRVKFGIYALSSSLGKIPSMTLFALIGHTIIQNPLELVYMIAIYGVFITVVYFIYRRWLKNVSATAPVEEVDPVADSTAERI
ncbi:TVP38/TMEM64 family protein [Alkalicoccus chagannorensis]|uniref:TVP38/TMEM64 family protein n=1 Tax=Alkalicoccus chagannorensis TaxID=427072 RepID=UPI0003FBC61F|nr:VTT domain-containing protein [Alkalicoccus chagannorensis]